MNTSKEAEKYIKKFIEKQSLKHNVDKNDIFLVMRISKDKNITFNLYIKDDYEFENNKIKKYSIKDIIGNLTYDLLLSMGIKVDDLILNAINLKNDEIDKALFNMYINDKNNKIVIDIYQNNEFIKKTYLT